MRAEYEIQGPKAKLEVDIEKEVIEKISQMTDYTKLSASEITNTALKRFIAGHKDFMPQNRPK